MRTGPRAALAALIVLAVASVAQAQSAEPVAVIDLRDGAPDDRRASRGELEDGITRAEGIQLLADPALRARLARDPSGATASRAADLLAEAAQAYGRLECERARERAGEAILAYAALQAAGAAVEAPLTQAYVYRLHCADAAGDSAAAMRAARMLRRLGAVDPPAGISAPLWDRYPTVDAATDQPMVELRVTTRPGGADLWIDHQRAGAAPLALPIAAGEHLVAAAGPSGAIAQVVTLAPGQPSTDLELALPAAAEEPAGVAGLEGWRQARTPDPTELGRLLTDLGVRFAVVMFSRRTEVWGIGPGSTVARRMGDPIQTADEVAAIVKTRVGAWQGRTPDPDLPLLREDPALRGGAPTAKEPHKWWVYASIIGAVAVGAAIIVANDLADDHQRIRLVWP